MKSWFKSRTIWFNLAAAVLGWASTSLGSAPIDPQFQLIGVGLINVLLRFITTGPVAIKASA